MDIFIGPKSSGKTHELVKAAARENGVVIVGDLIRKGNVLAAIDATGAANVTVYTLAEARHNLGGNARLFFDDAEHVLSLLFQGAHVAGVALGWNDGHVTVLEGK